MGNENEERGFTTENNNEEIQSFDVSAFSQGLENLDQNNTIKKETSREENDNQIQNSNGGNDDNSDFSWDSFDTDESQSENNEENNQENSDESQQENNREEHPDNGSDDGSVSDDNQNIDNAPTLKDFDFNSLSEELGIEVKSKEDFKSYIDSIKEENEKLKNNFPKKNENIDGYENLLKLEDKELVKQGYIADGFDGEDLENVLGKLEMNDMLEIEAKKIRNTVNKAIDAEKQAIIDEEKNIVAKQEDERQESMRALKTHLDSRNEMFGMKISKEEDEIQKIRDDHYNYIVSGSYLKEITESEKSLAESAWLWKNRKVLLKAFESRGFNRGTKKLFDEIGRPDANAGTRTFANPKGSGEFNPEKFTAS